MVLRLVLALVSVASGALAAPLPPARVPPPASFDLGAHELPVAVRTDVMWRAKELDAKLLDALAPLGTGGANAAAWWSEFVPGRSRASELAAARDREVESLVAGEMLRRLPWSDPLVQEALTTADQARLSFVQEGLTLQRLPVSLLYSIADSWLVHGLEEPDPARANDSFRRVVRLGRLLLQDDGDPIQPLMGMSFVEHGLEGLYERARREGDRRTQFLATLALLDRERVYGWETSRLQQIALPGHVNLADPAARLAVSDETMGRLEGAFEHSTVRRWRLQSITAAQVAVVRGDAEAAARATSLLRRAAEDTDPLVAEAARRALAGEGAEQAVLDAFGDWRERRAAKSRDGAGR